MIKHYLQAVTGALVLSLGLGAAALGQQRSAAPYFRDDASAARSALMAALRHSRPLTLDAAGLRAALATAPAETRPGAAPLTLALPLPDGTTGRFAVVATDVMAPALAAQFPQIRTYRGQGLDDPTATVRLDLTPQGFHAQILSPTTGIIYIDPATRGDQQHVLSFFRRDMDRAAAGGVPACGFQPTAAEQAETQRLAAAIGTGQRTLISTGTARRTYRLAVAATGEYTQFQGGTVALAQAAIVTTVNRVTGIYEKELAVRLQLVANNTSVVYTNAGTDPYTNGNPTSMIGENQTNMDAVLGSSNYDIGHVFGTNSGGLAGLRVVCVAGNKARAVTGSGAPVGDAFDIDYVAHEIGHQFGGNHSFNSEQNGCAGNRSSSRAYEPGSGSTIMSYAGLCSPDNIQNNSDAYFHTANFEEMASFIASTTCAVSTATGNTAPTVTTPAVRTLPIATPFRLTATATDAEGDALTYSWEQLNLGSAASLTTPQVANDNVPLFRSFPGSTSPTRTFPRLSAIISNSSPADERLPTVTRTLTFRCTARDQHNGPAGVIGGVNYSANLALPVTSAAGPFLVTAPNTAVSWPGGSTQTVTWNVAGTTANGVNCATVNILLSTDGGQTYPTTLASGVANDGSQSVTLPTSTSTTTRIMVAAADNYFFDISNANFTITAAVATAAPTVVTPANGSLTNDNTPTYSGTAPASSTVTVYVDATSIGTTTATAAGNWTFTPATALADGLHTVYATAQSSGQTVSGNSNTNSFTVDTTPPPAPVVSTPTNGSRLNTTTPTYSGTAEANATVSVIVDGSSVGTTTATASGSWTFGQPTALAQGSHSVRARATDAAGNTSADSNTNTFTVDTTAPTLAYFTSTSGASGSTVTTTPFTFEVGFSEQVTGFTASDVIVTNGTIASSNFFPITNSQYAFSVTPATPGVVTTVQIPAGAAQDFAGNDNVASAVYSLTYVAPVTATTWTGTVSTDWYTAGNWSAGVPTSSLNASIPANTPFQPVISSGTAQTLSLTIGTGAALTMSNGSLDVRADLINDGTFLPTGGTVIMGAGATMSNIFGSSRVRFWNLTPSGNGVRLSTPAGASVRRLLTLTDDVVTDDNGFVLESDATGTALAVNNGGAIYGRVTVQRYISPDLNPGPGYRHLASPVDDATVGGLATSGFTPVLNPAYNTSPTPSLVTPFPNVFAYDQSRLSSTANNLPAFDKGWASLAAPSDRLTLFSGYTVNVAAGQTLSFTGTLTFNSGILSRAFGRNNDATAPDAGWHLVGNPFPAPLDYSRVVPADRAGLDAAIYVYESTSQYGGRYRSYVNGFGNPILPLGQAFFVRVSSPQTNGTLAMRHSYRVTTYQNPVYHRTTDTRPVVRLTLKPVGATAGDDAFVYFEQGATDGFDSQYDAEKLPNPSGLNLSTSLSATQRLSIDGRAPLGTAQKVVPLAVGVPAVGSYTLAATELLNLTNVPTALRDLQTGALIDLALQPSYSFTVTNASALITGRFELVFSPQRPTATTAAQQLQLSVWPNPVAGQAALHLSLSKPLPAATATLRDVVGRTVAAHSFSGSATSLPTAGLAKGTYLLSVAAPGQAPVTRRIVVE